MIFHRSGASLCFGSFVLFGFGRVSTRVVLVDFLAGSCTLKGFLSLWTM